MPKGRLALTILLAVATFACGKVYDEVELPRAFELPTGTEISVAVKPDNGLAGIQAGDPFAGILTHPLEYKSEAVDPEGGIYTREEPVAPRGAPVLGTAVERQDPESGEMKLALRLTTVTVHGGKSFAVVTDPVWVPGPLEEGEAASAAPLVFELIEPADVALVIEYGQAGDTEQR